MRTWPLHGLSTKPLVFSGAFAFIHSFVHAVVAITWFTLFPMRLNCKSKEIA
jgi:hypothetical protein